MKHYPKTVRPSLAFDPKARHWIFRTYPDPVGDEPANNHELNTLIAYRLRLCGASFARILHDCDKNEDGTIKKAHYHWVVCFPAPRYLSTVLQITGLPEMVPEIARGELQGDARCRPAYRYLCHLDHPDKYQYPLERIEYTNITASELADLLHVSEEKDDPSARAMEMLRADVEAWVLGELTFTELLRRNPSEYRHCHNIDKMAQLIARDLRFDGWQVSRTERYTRESTPIRREWEKAESCAEATFRRTEQEQLEALAEAQSLIRSWSEWNKRQKEGGVSPYDSVGR